MNNLGTNIAVEGLLGLLPLEGDAEAEDGVVGATLQGTTPS